MRRVAASVRRTGDGLCLQHLERSNLSAHCPTRNRQPQRRIPPTCPNFYIITFWRTCCQHRNEFSCLRWNLTKPLQTTSPILPIFRINTFQISHPLHNRRWYIAKHILPTSRGIIHCKYLFRFLFLPSSHSKSRSQSYCPASSKRRKSTSYIWWQSFSLSPIELFSKATSSSSIGTISNAFRSLCPIPTKNPLASSRNSLSPM